MAIDAGNVIWNITGNVKPLNDALGDSEKMVQKSMGNILDISQKIGAAFAVVGTAAAAAFGVVINSAMDYGGAIQDASDKTAVNAETLQELKYAGEQASVGFDDLQKSIVKMNDGLGEAAKTGKGPMVDALASVGMTLQQLQGLSPDRQFLKLADAIASVPDPARRTTMAVDMFGKSGANLLPMFTEGSAGITLAMSKARELGLVLSNEGVAAAEAFGDQWETIKTQFQMIAVQIGSALIPALTELMPRIQATIASVIDWVKQNPDLVVGIGKVVIAVAGISAALAPVLLALPGIVSAFTIIKTLAASLSIAIPALGISFGALAAPILVLGAAFVLLTPLIHANIKAHQDLRAALDQEKESHNRLSAEIEKYIAWLEARGVAVDRAAIAQMTTEDAIAALNAQHAAARETQTYKDINELEAKKKVHAQTSDAIIDSINAENQARKQNALIAADALKNIGDARKKGVADEQTTNAQILAAQSQLSDATLQNYVAMGLMTKEQVDNIHEIMKGLSPATRHSPSINHIVGEGFGALVSDLNSVYTVIEGIGNKMAGVFAGIQDAIAFALSFAGGNGGGDAEHRAMGGPVAGGMPYIVGEAGQELFVPETDGRIVPAHQTKGMMGGNVTNNFEISGYNQDPEALAQKISRVLYRQQIAYGMS